MKKSLLGSAILGLAIASFMPMDRIGFSQSAEAQSLSNACRQVYANYRGKRGPKAFAVTSGGGCGSYWGANSLAAAQNGAMNACRRKG